MKRHLLWLAIFSQVGLTFAGSASWSAANGNWTSAGNWTPATVPNAAGNVATLSNLATAASPSVTLDANETIGSMQIDLGTPYTLLGASTLTFQDSSTISTLSITTVNGTAAHLIQCPVQIDNTLIVNQTALGAPGIFTIGPAAMSGSGGLTKVGAGTLVLSGTNSYGGGTIINGGSLKITANANLGATGTNVAIGNATLDIGGTLSSNRTLSLTQTAVLDIEPLFIATFTNTISGSGSLYKTNTGTLVLSGTNTYLGGTVINQGILSISNDANLGNLIGTITINNGTLLTTSGITSARPILLGGNAVVDTGGANTNTFSGAISGSGGITIQGGGRLILSGTNTYTGGTTISPGADLEGSTKSLPGNILVNPGTSLLFSQNVSGTYSGIITGSGALTTAGTGTITFTGDSSSFLGATTVSQGKLVLNGSLANSTMTVASGATLQGSGTVGTTVVNSGTIYPHSPSSTLSVNGNLTFNGSSAAKIDIAPLSADRIAVTGAASLTGADLIIHPTEGYYGTAATYTIVTSADLGGTTFNSPPISTIANFVPTVTYTSNTVVLNVQIINPFYFPFPFSNGNTASVGSNIGALATAGELSADFKSILNLFVPPNFHPINDALDQLHPAPYSGFTELQEEMGAQLISLFHRKPYLPSSMCSNPRRLWIEIFGNNLTEKNHGMQWGFTADTEGIALGIDTEITPDWIVGVGGAWDATQFRWAEHHGHGNINGFYGALYSDYQVWNFYLGAALLGGVDLYDTSRNIQFYGINRHPKGDFHGLDLIAQFCTAYFFGKPAAFLLYPYANFDFLYTHIPSFHETGASSLNLYIDSHTASTFRTEMGLGFQFTDTNAASTCSITPLISLGWVNMCPTQRPSYSAKFEGTTISFFTQGWDQTWNLLALDFGLNISFYCYSLKLEYSAEISGDSHALLYNQHANIHFDWKW